MDVKQKTRIVDQMKRDWVTQWTEVIASSLINATNPAISGTRLFAPIDARVDSRI